MSESKFRYRSHIEIPISTSTPKSKFRFRHRNIDGISMEFRRNFDFVKSKQSKSKFSTSIIMIKFRRNFDFGDSKKKTWKPSLLLDFDLPLFFFFSPPFPFLLRICLSTWLFTWSAMFMTRSKRVLPVACKSCRPSCLSRVPNLPIILASVSSSSVEAASWGWL
jgi:hypothetical protein